MGFIDENFLLKTETAKKLFNDYAKAEPIYDFHCHLNPQEIYENKNFEDIIEYNAHPAMVYGARVSRMVLDQVLACEGSLWLTGPSDGAEHRF